MSAIHVRPAPLLAMGALALSSLLLVAWYRLNLPSAPPDTVSQISQRISTQVDLLFVDLPDGGVLVQRAGDGTVLAQIQMGEGGFVRATLRSLIREQPNTRHHFRLAMTEQGQLLLWHPISGRVLDLKAYGPSNRQVFLEFIHASESTP